MSWNSSMNTGGVMEMLTDTDENGDYVIPRIIYSDAYSSEMVAYADLILPDTTYLERHDCISLLDRPICEADAAADAIRWPVVEPDRDVRGFQSVLCDLGARLGLPGFINEDGSAEIRRLRRLHRPSRTQARHWSARRVAHGSKRSGQWAWRRERRAARKLHQERRLLRRTRARRGALLQAVESRLSGLGRRAWASSTRRSPISFSFT